MYSISREKKSSKFICLNKENILFVRESEDSQTEGVDVKSGYKSYPYIPKLPILVKLYLPFYTLTGYMHCAERERLSDLLNQLPRFIPLIDVEICPSVSGNRESGVSFIAVNKHQIILLEDLQAEGMKMPAPIEASELSW